MLFLKVCWSVRLSQKFASSDVRWQNQSQGRAGERWRVVWVIISYHNIIVHQRAGNEPLFELYLTWADGHQLWKWKLRLYQAQAVETHSPRRMFTGDVTVNNWENKVKVIYFQKLLRYFDGKLNVISIMIWICIFLVICHWWLWQK